MTVDENESLLKGDNTHPPLPDLLKGNQSHYYTRNSGKCLCPELNTSISASAEPNALVTIQ
jgi:hypothetical protein